MIDVHDSARLAELHAALGSGPRPDPEALVAVAAEALRRTAHEQAAALLDAALVLEPACAPAWALYGALELARERPAEARRAYERALSLDDGDLQAALVLAELYARGAAQDPRDRERALALLDWLLLELHVPADVVESAARLKSRLKGAR